MYIHSPHKAADINHPFVTVTINEKKKTEEKEMAKCTIVGIKKGTTKNDKVCFNYYALKEFSYYDKGNSECWGQDIVSAFSYTDYHLEVGDLVDFRYEPGFEGKATLSDIVMLQPAAVPPFENGDGKSKGK